MTTSKTKLTMKLLVDTKAKRVLFAEADKSCVDILFHILSLPVATVIRLLKEKGMSYGCLPKSSVTGISSIPFLSISDVPATQKTIYGCSSSNSYIQCRSCYSDSSNARCIDCQNSLSRMLTYVAPPGASGAVAAPRGFVKDVVTYMVMDNLVVKPMSTISTITLLNKFNVKDVGVLQEALKLLKASFESKTVLTSVFMSSIKVPK
ncbi:hypothetical protein P3S67_009628 [Capsicum chacoense]